MEDSEDWLDPSCGSVEGSDLKEEGSKVQPRRETELCNKDTALNDPTEYHKSDRMEIEDPGSSGVSLRSDMSMGPYVDFSDKDPTVRPSLKIEDPVAGPSGVSLRSDMSMDPYVDLNDKDPTVHPRDKQSPEGKNDRSSQNQLDDIFKRLEENILAFIKVELKRYYKILASDYPECLESEDDEEQNSREAFLRITLDFLRRIDLGNLAERLQSKSDFGVCQRKVKNLLCQRFSCVYEGIDKSGNLTPLNQIYTELYITEGGAAGINEEHEVIYIETSSRRSTVPENTISCKDIFQNKVAMKEHGPIQPELTERQRPTRTELTEKQEQAKLQLTKVKAKEELSIIQEPFMTVLTMISDKLGPIKNFWTKSQEPIKTELTARHGPIRTVLTKGVAGIGKTALTQKFSLDWAEGKANQDIQLLFPFTFRELNVLRDRQFSLVGLLHHFFYKEVLSHLEQHQVVFIFDGLDEYRLPLDFDKAQVLTDPTESSSVDVLLVNLIRGSLLPSARLWITTRPAAANLIPSWYVSMVTEVRGFTDPQKEQYFRKRFRDQQQATAVISHIKASRSLHIMCHMPIFCWIVSTVLQHEMENGAKDQLPKTLTQMYIHFLVVQAKVKIPRYDDWTGRDTHWTSETRKMVESLGKLAFEQLQKGNLIFYESDLRECGLDPTEASVYSGVFTQVFREESGLYQDKVYCFIHLSVQEFLAALYIHLTFLNSGVNLLSWEILQSCVPEIFKGQFELLALHQSAVDQTLLSKNGHLDLFLRFLLGLSVPKNQTMLHGLLPQTGESSHITQKTVEYVKKRISEDLPTERIINLFHCLNELMDRSLTEQIQCYIREGRISKSTLSPAQWSALAFILLSSDKDLEVFDLKKYHASEEAFLRLLLVVKASNKALLSICNLSKSSCGPLSSILSSSSLRYLDLSNNDLQDSGVELLCSGLKSAPCRLETLWLSGCLVSEKGGASVALALSSAPSHLRELDLSYNHLGPSAVLLTALLSNPLCPLETLRLGPTGVQWMTPGLTKYFCKLTLDPNTAHRNLRVSSEQQTVQHVWEMQPYPDHPDRFISSPQVLCSSALQGRCYWEVFWKVEWDIEQVVDWSRGVNIAVSYKGTTQNEESTFGYGDQSWTLTVCKEGYSVCHNGKRSSLYTLFPPCSSGYVGVYLDYSAGSLSFYEPSSKGLIHIYTFNTTFTKPVFAGFGLGSGSMSLMASRFAVQFFE